MLFHFDRASKSYGPNSVFRDLSFEIKEGEFIALIGKNGAGKSTLMRCLAQIEGVDSGVCRLKEMDFSSPSSATLEKVFFLHENFNLIDTSSVSKWKKFVESVSPEFDPSIYNDLIRNLQIDESKTFAQLSRGQRMKAVFSVFSATRPQIYIIDEVTSVLDSGSRFVFMEFLNRERQRGCTIILSTNMASELVGYADRLMVLDKNGLTCDLSVAKLKDHFVKVRIDVNNQEQIQSLLAKGGQPLRKNTDGYLTFVIQSKDLKLHDYVDNREITIEDVAIYYTSISGGL